MTEVVKERWSRFCWAVVGVFAVLSALLVAQVVTADHANAYPGNKVYNQTGSSVSMQWDNGVWVNVQDYTFGVKTVKIPTGKCYRFIGPGVNVGYRAYLSPLYKSIGAGTWWVQNC